MYSPKLEDLYPAQRKLANKILTSWKRGSSYVAQVGMRSGGTTIAVALANAVKFDNAFIIAETLGMGQYTNELLAGKGTVISRQSLLGPGLSTNSLESYVEMTARRGDLTNDTVVIIDQPFWMRHSELIFDTFDLYTPRVLAIGSKGTVRWQNRKRIDRYATWDLNHTVPVAGETIRHAFASDRESALRDFGKGTKLEDAHVRFRHLIGR